MALRPKLLIADEPTSALDATVAAQILDLLQTLQREFGTSIMLITHDLRVAAQAAHRVAVMYAGRIVETGPVARVFEHPAHPYTRGLMAAAPSNRTRAGRLTPIPGAPPDLSAPDSGCAFVPRCSYAEPRCRAERPPLRMVAAERSSACHLAERVLATDEKEAPRGVAS
jgi:oligopeptide transport system ATP-binding protein